MSRWRRTRAALFAQAVAVVWLVPLASQAPARTVTAGGAPVLDLVGQTGGVVGSLAVQGDRVYAVVGTSLAVIDVSDASTPRQVARGQPVGAPVADLAVTGDRAYVATRDEIVALDLSAPGGPSVASAYRADGWFHVLAADGGHVYTWVSHGTGVGAFQVLTAADDGQLTRVGELSLLGSISTTENAQMVVSGPTVYLACETLGVVAFDVSVPAAPKVIGAYEEIWATGIAVGQDRLYVIGKRRSLTNPEQREETPYLIALSTRAGSYLSPDVTLKLTDGNSTDFAAYVATGDRFVYVGRSGGSDLHIVDGRQPDSLPDVGVVKLPWSFVWYNGPKSIAVDRGRVFVAMNGTCGLGCQAYGRFNGVLALDGTPPGAVTGAWLVDQPADPWDVAAGEGSVAVSGGTQAIHFVETCSPTMPTFQGAIELIDPVSRLAASGHRLLASTNNQITLIDFADPADPRLIEDVGLGGLRDVSAVATDGDIACAVGRSREADTEARLVLWGIGPDQHLAHRGELVLGRWPDHTYDQTIHEGLAYLASLTTGLTIVDVRDPNRPAIMSRVAITRSALAVAVAGHHAFVSTRFLTPAEEKARPNPRLYAGLTVLDVADPRQPQVVGTYATFLDNYFPNGLGPWGVAVLGHYVILSLHDRLLRVLDVADPTVPRLVQSIEVPTGTYGVAAAADLVYVAANEGGLLVFRRHGPDGGGGVNLYLPLAIRPRLGAPSLH